MLRGNRARRCGERAPVGLAEHARRGARWSGAQPGASTRDMTCRSSGKARSPATTRSRVSSEELEPPVWVVTSDRGLRERVRDHAERIIGGGSFARELRKTDLGIPRSRYLVRGNSDRTTLPIHTVWAGRSSPSSRSSASRRRSCVRSGDCRWTRRPRSHRRPPPGGCRSRRRSRSRAARDRRGPPRSRSGSAKPAVRPCACARGLTTPFGSQRALGVVATRHGRWLAVTDAAVGNNRVVWVDAKSGGLRYTRTPLELDVDLSARTLTVNATARPYAALSIGVGRAGSPTPTGTFAVTDKLNGSAYSAAYGCCILALSATQPNLPVGWTGGNRIAIHGTLSAERLRPGRLCGLRARE